MLDRLPHILFYAAIIGLVVLLAEHVLESVKRPVRERMGLKG